MIRIAYVIDRIETSAAGTERQLIALLNGLDPTEFAPHLVCLYHRPWLDERTFSAPLTTYAVHSFFRPGFLRDLGRFRALCRRERFDIIQTFFVDSNIFGTLGARLAGRGVVVSSRRNLGYWHDRPYIAVLRGLRHWTHWYVANSEAAAAQTVAVEGVDRSKVTVIHNGLDFEAVAGDRAARRLEYRRRWGVPEESFLIGCVANLRDVKNLQELVAAVARLAPECADLRAVIIGEGPDRGDLERQIRDRGLAERIHLIGRLEDARPALAAFDIGVQCSRSESFSNSLIEYMGAGLPVVASDIPGNVEAIRHQETGLLYPLGDDAALALALRRLMTDRVLARQLGEAAAIDARRRFGMQAMLDAHAAFYRRIVGDRKSG